MRRIPRRDGGHHADGLFQNDEPSVRQRRWDRVAVNPAGLFGEPLNEGHAIVDLIARFEHGAANFHRHDARKIFAATLDLVHPTEEAVGTLLGGGGAPGIERRGRGYDGGPGIIRRAVGDLGNRGTGRRVLDDEVATVAG